MPTYHLANIVDDHLMKITHVIRGEEWLPSMPLHILMYRAFGWKAPQFSHLPLILKPAGMGNGKLSKRDGDKMGFPVFPLLWKDPETGAISKGYREDGYLPEALLNFLALLGWNAGTDQEIFTKEELIKLFDLERVSKSGARFDIEKAKWFNHQYLHQKNSEELAKEYLKILSQKNVISSQEIVEKIVALIRDRATFITDFWELSSFFFIAPTQYDEKAMKKQWKENSSEILDKIVNILSSQEDFSSANTEHIVKEFITNNGFSLGQVMPLIRLALVGDMKGPHIFDIAEIIGKDETIKRLEKLKNN